MSVIIPASLYAILQEVAAGHGSQSMFKAYCRQMNLDSNVDIKYKFDPGEHDVSCWCIWNGTKYNSYTYRDTDSDTARSNLYQQMLKVVLEQEMAKIKKIEAE